MMSRDPIFRAGIVGCGKIGSVFDETTNIAQVLTHAEAYSRIEKTRLIVGCDKNPSRLEEFGRNRQVPSLYTDYKQMLEEADLDIISICTSPESHLKIFQEAVKKGLKMVFCEKPLSDNLEDARRMARMARKNRVTLAVNYLRRWDKALDEIKCLISAGEIGEIQKINCLYTRGIINNGSHLIDLLIYLFGMPSWVNSTSPSRRKVNPDPTLDGVLKFKSPEYNFLCYIQGITSAYSIFEVDILGELGRICLENSGFDVHLCKARKDPLFVGYKTLESVPYEFHSTLGKAMVLAVKDIIQSYQEVTNPQCSGEDALESLRVSLAILESAQHNGNKVHIRRRK